MGVQKEKRGHAMVCRGRGSICLRAREKKKGWITERDSETSVAVKREKSAHYWAQRENRVKNVTIHISVAQVLCSPLNSIKI